MAYEDEYYGTPQEVLGYERVQQGQDRLDLQEARYAQMAEQQAYNNRLRAIQASMRMGGLRPDEEQGFRDELYDQATGGLGKKPGFTYANHLLDQAQFWDQHNARAQAKYEAKQQAQSPEYQANFQQAVAQQSAQRRVKAAQDALKSLEASSGFNPALAMSDYTPESGQGYDAASGFVHVPGKSILNRDTGEFVQGPPMRVPFGAAARSRVGDLWANSLGYDNFAAMNQTGNPSSPANTQAAEVDEMHRLQQKAALGQKDPRLMGQSELDQIEQEQEQLRIRRAQAAAQSAVHRMQLHTNPGYRASFFTGLGNENAAMRENVQGAPPVQPPMWMNNMRGF